MTPRQLGRDGPLVSEIGLGAMALSFAERPGETAAIGLIHAVLERGVTLLDTADVYAPDEGDTGHNERLIAKALRTWNGPRDRLVVATKGGCTRRDGQLLPNGRPDHLRSACERSLRALEVERIDLYQLHTIDPAVPLADSVGALSRLKDEGKIGWVGLSNVTVAAIDTARTVVPIQSVQNELSLLRRDSLRRGPVARLERLGVRGVRQLRRLVGEPFQSGVLAHCQRQGIGFLAYSPLGGARNREMRDHTTLAAIARGHGASAYAVAIAWLLAQGQHVVPIPSARSRAHAEDALSGSTITLSAAELTALDAAPF